MARTECGSPARDVVSLLAPTRGRERWLQGRQSGQCLNASQEE